MADSDSSDSETPAVKQNVIIKTTVEHRPSRATNRRSSRIMSLAPNRRLVPVVDPNEIPPEISASIADVSEITRRYSTALLQTASLNSEQKDESAEQNSNSLEDPPKSEPSANEDSPNPPRPDKNSTKKKKKAMFVEPEREERDDTKSDVHRRATAYPKDAKKSVSEDSDDSVV